LKLGNLLSDEGFLLLLKLGNLLSELLLRLWNNCNLNL
jgi:hypothetical protein